MAESMSAEIKAETARTIIRSLEVNLYNAISLEAMLSRANDDPALREAYDHTYEAHGINIIHHTLIDQLIMTLRAEGFGNSVRVFSSRSCTHISVVASVVK